MAPRRAKEMVIRSPRKVVQASLEVSVVGSTKGLTRGKRDIQIGEEVGTPEKERGRIIPVQEVTPQPQDDADTNTNTTEDKAEPEKSQNGGVQHGTEVQNWDTVLGLGTQKEELIKEPSTNNDEIKKAKSHEGKDDKLKRKKKRGRRSGEGYQRYVYRVLKQVHPDMGISSKAMTVLNNLMNDMFERLADEAVKLKTYTGHMTLSSREIHGAVKLVLPGELGKHAIAEGVKAVDTYMSNDT